MAAHDRFESLATEWHTRGRPATLLLAGYDLIALRCWSYSAGAKVDGMSALLLAFIQASDAAQRDDWLDDYLSDREACRSCGERYRFENLMLCTHCSRTYCHRCASERSPAANGNIACSCGGELVG